MPDQNYPQTVFQFCPRCGSKGFKAESPKSFKCGGCGFRFFINPAAAVAALIFDKKGHLLLTLRRHDPAKGMLDLPGGFVDIGEKAEDALIREIKEELNLTIDNYEFFGTFPNEYLFGGIVYFTLDLVFKCKVTNLSPLKPADDVIACKFVSPEKIDLNDVGLSSVRNIIRHYLGANSSF